MANLPIHQKIFGVGLSRTGTSSLSEALRILEIRTIHYPRDRRTREQLMAGDYDLALFDRYQAFTDITVAPFFVQFDKLLPDSRFILTVRDKRSWLDSIEYKIGTYKTGDEFAKFILRTVFDSTDPDRESLDRAYERHLDRVTSYFEERPEDLLIFDIVGGDGWEKLCSFLRIQPPDLPFPFINRRRKGAESFSKQVELTAKELEEAIPEGSTFVLVNDKKFGNEMCPGREALPFLERDGHYYGKPSDDDMAIRELERLRRAGATYIVFSWVSFWWFDHYAKFYEYVQSSSRCIAKSELVAVFELA